MKTNAAPKLVFARRAKVKTSDVAVLRRFPSTCGRYAVVESKSLLRAHGIEWLAIHVMTTGEILLQRRRTRESAELVCLSHLEGQS